MIRSHSRIEKRAAFTLVELMVVVLIIAVLVSMLLAGVSSALKRGTIVQTRVEIGQLETGVQTVISTYRIKYVPSLIKLSEAGKYYNQNTVGSADYYSVRFLKRMFPRLNCGTSTTAGTPIDWNRDKYYDPDTSAQGVILQGPECLVFFLGGPGTGTPGNTALGFSANPSNPADTVSLQAPAFTFDLSRLVQSHHAPGFYYYINNYGKHAQPYLYFTSYDAGNDYSSQGPNYGFVSDCGGYGVAPYQDPATGNFIKPHGFQIISAGAQGVLGKGQTRWSPVSGSSDPNTKDNQANFAPGLLVAGE